MKKFLPTSPTHSVNKSGFTLIELLVVIAIIAILAVIGFAIVSTSTTGAKDARRRSDINALADALEQKKFADPANPLSTYVSITGADLSSGTIPDDPDTGFDYCMWSSITAAASADTSTLTWAATSACPTVSATVIYAAFSPTITTGTTAWRLCARLNSGTAYCRISGTK